MSTVVRVTHEYCGYTIVPKEDFGPGPGFLIDGKWVKEGWVVVQGGCNVMPAATWFQTTEEAIQGIAAWELAKKICPDDPGQTFWHLMKLRGKP